MVIACDFDGVIHDKKNPLPGSKMGLPMYGAKESLDGLKREGHTINIFSVRGGSKDGVKSIKDFMERYDIPYDTIGNKKLKSDVYLDDNSVHFDNWGQALDDMKQYG